MSVFPALSTLGVVVARVQTLRPLSGSSRIDRSLMVSWTVALSVFSTWARASTFTVSATPPGCKVALVRTTWLVATSTPVVLKVWNPASVTVIS